MTRSAVAFDRLAVFIAGLCLATLGCLAIAWQRGVFGEGVVKIVFAEDTRSSWWPWASAAAGVALILLGLRWLAAHRWSPKAARVALQGNSHRLTADAASAADAAGAALAAEPGVLKAGGGAVVERGVPTVTLTATVPARRGLNFAVAAADCTSKTVGVMLGESVALRTVLRVDVKHGPAVE